MKLQRWLFVAMVAGAAAGALAQASHADWLMRSVVALQPIGTIFLRLVTMVVVPLVIASVFVSVASLGDVRQLGRIGGRTLAYFLLTTVAAASIGMVVALIMHVGSGVNHDLVPQPIVQAGASHGGELTAATFGDALLNIVPQNPFASAAQADLLPLIIAVLFFGAAAAVLPDEKRRVVVAFMSGVNDLCTVVIGWIMRAAPIGVFALMATTVAHFGVSLLGSLLGFALAVVIALSVHVVAILLPVLIGIGRVSVRVFVGAVSEALLLAFSTASSAATLPVTLRDAKRLGVPDAIADFVLPTGATINKNGAAAYKAVTAVFVMTLFGASLGPGTMIIIVAASSLAAFAGAGVPGSSLVTTVIVLNAVGLDAAAVSAGIALVAGIDRPLDMCRTLVNTISNLVGATVVARASGADAK